MHGAYAALGGGLGTAIAGLLAGPDLWPWVVVMALASVVGAGIWAQVVEGSSQLLRPFGYFGSVGGAVLTATAAGAAGADGWRLAAAFAVGATFTQAIGRLRCLVQGCCHGREAPAWAGIRHMHPCSRVVRLAHLAGVPVYPTALISLVWMLFESGLRTDSIRRILRTLAGTKKPDAVLAADALLKSKAEYILVERLRLL